MNNDNVTGLNEKILSIEEIDNIEIEDYHKYSGFVIKTEKRTIQILIDSSQQCCEEWGYISTPDDINEFIGAKLNGWKDSDCYSDKDQDNLVRNTVSKRFNVFDDCCGQFITLFTSKGEITFTVYNCHNGYYSHGAFIQVDEEIVCKGYF